MKAVNLLPPDLRGAGKPASAVVASGDDAAGRTGAFAVLGVLAFCVVALAAYVLTSNTIKDRQAKLEQVSAQSAALTQKATRLKPYADFASTTKQRLQTVRDLASARFDWEQALRDISRAIPADVTLSSMTGSLSGDASTSGATSDPMRADISAPAISLAGCTRGQRQVAVLMSRLRTVQGVTRVALSKSERPDPTATGSGPATTAAAPGASSTTLPCGPKRPPTFSIVMFFERSQVPATLDEVTAGPGATKTAAGAASSAAGAASSASSSASSTSTTTSSPATTTTTP